MSFSGAMMQITSKDPSTLFHSGQAEVKVNGNAQARSKRQVDWTAGKMQEKRRSMLRIEAKFLEEQFQVLQGDRDRRSAGKQTLEPLTHSRNTCGLPSCTTAPRLDWRHLGLGSGRRPWPVGTAELRLRKSRKRVNDKVHEGPTNGLHSWFKSPNIHPHALTFLFFY
jgi:hypothetical protein